MVFLLLRLLDAALTVLHVLNLIVEASTSPAPQFATSTNRKKTIIKQTHAPRKKKGRLAERLIQAAVLAHANPTERLRHRRNSKSHESSRRALHFVKDVDSLVNMNSKGRAATLVDPRKIAPFHEPSSFTHGSLPLSLVTKTLKQKPLTTWKSKCPEFSGSSNPRGTKKKASSVHENSTRIPLSFIPLKDAEAAYTFKLTSAQSVFFIPCLLIC
jgi:hypothetical protein